MCLAQVETGGNAPSQIVPMAPLERGAVAQRLRVDMKVALYVEAPARAPHTFSRLEEMFVESMPCPCCRRPFDSYRPLSVCAQGDKNGGRGACRPLGCPGRFLSPAKHSTHRVPTHAFLLARRPRPRHALQVRQTPHCHRLRQDAYATRRTVPGAESAGRTRRGTPQEWQVPPA